MRRRARSVRRGSGLIGLVAAVLFAVPAVASAATYTVGTTTDSTGNCPNPAAGTCSLRQLITYENTSGTDDTIVVPAGGYGINSALTITGSMSIVGAGASTTTVDELAADRVFAIQAPSGGPEPTVSISGLSIWFGAATASNGSFGGNVLNQGTLTLSEDWIQGGTAQSGAGISNDGGTLTVTHSLVSNNDANSGGADSGGIQNVGPNPVTGTAATLEVDNSTISNNTSNLGGGIFSWCGGANNACSTSSETNTTTIVNSTIAYNDGGTRATNGGGLLVGEGTISVRNSIVAFNTVDNPSSGTASNCGGIGITSLGHNLETGTDCGFNSAGDLQSTDPQFTSTTPEDNGGNTNTLAPAASSPAVDAVPAGSVGCGGTDQRDVTRPQGTACDIGAVESFQPVEGAQFTTVLASATCGVDTGQPITVDWGDGTSSAGSPDSSGQALVGTHTYAEEGTYNGSVTYQPGDCSERTTPFSIKVADAPLSATGASFTATRGAAFTGTVATLTDADPGGVSSDYSVTINWGDGATSSGTVGAAPGGFRITGTHTYGAAGSYATTVSITDAGGASAVARGTATVDAPPSPVLTGAPAAVGITTAGFTGSVNPSGLPTTAFFQYGLDPKYTGAGPLAYTQSTPPQAVGSDFATHTVSSSVSGLVPNALYHVRLVATNSAGTTVGPDMTFMTAKAPPPKPPTLGKTFNVSVVSGVVLVELHGQLVPITELEQIPAGTLIDALHGTLKLTIAVNGITGARDAAVKGKKKKKPVKTQSGNFGGAIFKITQPRGGANKGLAILSLVENAFKGAPSYATCKAHKAADASAAALSSKTLQLLHASAHGKFRTKGRYSAATVRGTKWTVADRCDGTLTRDITDSVVVNDFVHHKTVVLHAGQSYLAKAPKHK